MFYYLAIKELTDLEVRLLILCSKIIALLLLVQLETVNYVFLICHLVGQILEVPNARYSLARGIALEYPYLQREPVKSGIAQNQSGSIPNSRAVH